MGARGIIISTKKKNNGGKTAICVQRAMDF